MDEVLQKIASETSVKTREISKYLLEKIDLDFSAPEDTIAIVKTQKAALNAMCDVLEEQEQKLREELRLVVMEYSAKIAAIHRLIRLAGQEIGKREAWEIEFEAGETT
ncbi:hypothetical protein [Paenibacillus naphthalenovorans]|uniref:hypothetical protein n=1 Tax=Paenibacillus naphthalenovorans TaxID=162209 RepID=UPI003D28DAFD